MTYEERLRNLEETVGDPEENQRMRTVIANHYWKFARTATAYAPHEYTLRKYSKDPDGYAALVRHIWRYGMDALWQKDPIMKRYWFDHEGGYYYFIFPEDVDSSGNVTEEAYLINRAKIADYPFWIEDSADGMGTVRCRYGFGRKPDGNKG